MKQQEVLERIAQQKTQLSEKYGVEKIGVFGSYARGEATEKSDVDILVSFSRPIGLEIVDLIEELENLFGKKVDLVTEDALKPRIKEEILREVMYS